MDTTRLLYLTCSNFYQCERFLVSNVWKALGDSWVDYQFALLIPQTLFGLLDPKWKIPSGSIFSANCLSIIQSDFIDLTEKSVSSSPTLWLDSQLLSLLRKFYMTKFLVKDTANSYTAESPTGILFWVNPSRKLNTACKRGNVSSGAGFLALS